MRLAKLKKSFNCILLVDDDGVTNFSNYRLLKQAGLSETIQTEVNGEKALSFIQSFSQSHENKAPELILVDLRMPVLNGIELIAHLLMQKFSNKSEMKILALTGSCSPEEVKALEKLKVEYIQKPLTLVKLQSHLAA